MLGSGERKGKIERLKARKLRSPELTIGGKANWCRLSEKGKGGEHSALVEYGKKNLS